MPASLPAMILVSTTSPRLTAGRCRWQVAAAAVCAGTVAFSTGCGASTGATGSAKSLTPAQAVTLAADDTQQLSSLAGTFSAQLSGNVTESMTGTVQMQLRPATLIEDDLNVSAQALAYSMDEILSTQYVYINIGELIGRTGKAWIRIPLSSLSKQVGSSISDLFQSLQTGNPMAQTRMLAAAFNVRAAGVQAVDGVRTTRYTGSLTAASARAGLPPALRAELSPLLKLVSGDIRFEVWIDGQHVARKIVEVYRLFGDTVRATFNVTAVNQPVHITPPRTSQVTTLPGADLAGL
jgi:hypothetical protein